MSSRRVAVAVSVAVVAALAVTWGVGRDAAPRRSGRAPLSPRVLEASPSPLPRIDPHALRDVFRFADEPAASGPAEPGPGTRASAEPVSGPRLVGLIRRGDRLLAALAIDGEVLLAGPGETVAGLTVVSVDDEAVRVRGSDGREETLSPP